MSRYYSRNLSVPDLKENRHYLHRGLHSVRPIEGAIYHSFRPETYVLFTYGLCHYTNNQKFIYKLLFFIILQKKFSLFIRRFHTTVQNVFKRRHPGTLGLVKRIYFEPKLSIIFLSASCSVNNRISGFVLRGVFSHFRF